ncbi:MAG: hypothetical protein H6672_19760 [Anaerolineaceae bacterium]|nr:hypothetical protein [Anaerolineaceae bacterium]
MYNKWFPAIGIILFLVIIVFFFNLLSRAVDLIYGGYGEIPDIIHVIRDAGNMGLPTFIMAWGFWEVHKRLNWPTTPRQTSQKPSQQADTSGQVFLNGDSQVVARRPSNHSKDILRIHYKK